MALDQEEEEEEACCSSSHGLLDRMDLLTRSVLNIFGESQSSKHKTRCSAIFLWTILLDIVPVPVRLDLKRRARVRNFNVVYFH